MTVVLYHNPRCSKSRATLALLRERGIEPRIVEYLKSPPSVAEIRRLMDGLDQPPAALVRSGEKAFADSGLAADESDPDTLAAAIAEHPSLLQRPVVVANGQARIGRPPEQVLDIL